VARTTARRCGTFPAAVRRITCRKGRDA
jgi:hypothetical protein